METKIRRIKQITKQMMRVPYAKNMDVIQKTSFSKTVLTIDRIRCKIQIKVQIHLIRRFKCGKKGHIKTDCKETDTNTINLINSYQNMVWFITTSKQPYKLPVIYDQEYRIDSLLDTGAPTSFIATHVLRQMEKEGKPYYRLPSRTDFFGVNGLPLQTEGMVYIQTEIIDENGNTLI